MDRQILDFLFRTLPLPTEYRIRDARERLTRMIGELLHRERIANGRVLAMQGVVPNKLLILAEGKAKALQYNGRHQFPYAPYLYDAPAIMADLKAFYKRKDARFGIEVIPYSMVYSVSRADIDYIEQSFPKIAAVFRLLIKQQNTYLREYKESCHRLTAGKRYAAVAEKNGTLLESYLQKDVAAHVGVAPETFNRLLKRLGRDTLS